MADRVERITELLMVLLDAQHPVSFEHLVEHTELYVDRQEASRKSFERDKAVLRQLGVEISTEVDHAGSTLYRIRPDDYFLPEMDLTESERLALQLAASTVRLDEAWDEQAMAKLGSTTSAPPYVVAEIPSLDALPQLFGAMRDRALASFSYSSRDRLVAGYGLFYRNGHWYFTGDEDGTVKVYRVDRIEGKVTAGKGGSYDIPAGADSGEAMPKDPILIGDSVVTEALVWVDSSVAGRVARLRGAENVREKRDDGSVVVSVPVRNRDAFRSWLLGLRDHAVVLEPADLRADIVSWLESIVGAA